MHMQFGQTMDKIQKGQKPTATSKKLGTKAGVRNKSRVFYMPAA